MTKYLMLAAIARRSVSGSSQKGLTLIEAIIATLFFGVTVSVVLPGFMNFQTSTLRNEGELGAVAVSQQILDELRRVEVTSLPSSGTTTTLPSGASTTKLYLGKEYSAAISYCPRIPTDCDANTRQIQVQVSLHGKPIYTVETLFAKFETPNPS
jgi:Tfp pilus assembly protein PilV